MLNFLARRVPGARHILEHMPKVGPLDTLRIETPLQHKIGDADLLTDPYPYFVTDDVLPEAMLMEFRENWPRRADFTPEIAHTYVCETTSLRISEPAKRKFWRNVNRTVARELGAAVAVKFRPWIAARFGRDVDVEFARVTLMESDPSYAGHGCHTHHYHAPGWIGTLLLYLDAEASGHPGTTVLRYAGNSTEAQARMAARTLRWQDEPSIAEVETVDYRRNRLLAFLDSPVSYHSVGAARPNAVGNRRIFRIHLTVPERAATRAYGVSHAEYVRKLRQPTEDPQVVEWMMKDIAVIDEQSRQVRAAARSGPAVSARAEASYAR